MSRVLALLFFLFMAAFKNDAVAQNNSIQLNCEKLCTEVVSYVTLLMKTPVPDDEWASHSINYTLDTISYMLKFGIKDDTTFAVKLIVLNGEILELEQKLSDKFIGLNIANGKMISFNPYKFETFNGLSSSISVSTEDSRIMFCSKVGCSDEGYCNLECKTGEELKQMFQDLFNSELNVEHD